ncbi:Signal peptidase complex catalytic subunit [Saxophila tyrrhenica]|uniref:Signal peptidase complex catalytic subunit SEC11 n=1 Tax=Saxophila tyrrhenica TaxID=1690608 RepID=A0AAV9PMJ8_9PEZI|nr:Signal peptidase complex catalytic subunit [Saxophila tyrrhenica]
MHLRQLAILILGLCTQLSTPYMLYKGLGVAANTHSPIVGVLSGSMEPGFHRGDLLFLWNRGDTRVGDIVVYTVQGKNVSIVHRVIAKFGGGAEPLSVLTKRDNNQGDDRPLYAPGQQYVDREKDVVGRVVGTVPYVGYLSLVMEDYPWAKVVLGGLIALSVMA